MIPVICNIGLGVASLIGGGISAVAGLFGGKKSNDANIKVAREYNQGQMDLAKYQNEQNIKMWNMQNEYNTPAMQMERMQEAGLNPHLMYGQGTTGNASSAPDAMTPQMTKPDLSYQYVADAGKSVGDAVQSYIQAQMADASIKKIDADTALTRQNIVNMQEDEKLKKLHQISMGFANSKSQKELEFWEQRYNAEMAVLDSTNVLQRSASELNDARRFDSNAMRPLRKQLIKAQTRLAVASALLHDSNVKLNSARVDQIANSIELTDSQITSNNLENIIRTKLIHSGVNLRGSLLERVVNSISRSLERQRAEFSITD